MALRNRFPKLTTPTIGVLPTVSLPPPAEQRKRLPAAEGGTLATVVQDEAGDDEEEGDVGEDCSSSDSSEA